MKTLNSSPKPNKLGKSMKYLVLVMSSILCTATVQADVKTKKIGDLEIYSVPTAGGGTVMMVLGNSNMMGSIGVPIDYSNVEKWSSTDRRCRYFIGNDTSVNGSVVVKKDDGTDGDTISYIRSYCYANAADQANKSPNKYFDRNTKLKETLIRFFANPQAYLGDNYTNYKVGLSNYGQRKDAQGPGRVVVPALPLTYENRLKLLNGIGLMTPDVGADSLANAMIENAAYMFGTRTAQKADSTGYAQLGYFGNGGKDLFRCPPGTIVYQQNPNTADQCNNATNVKTYGAGTTPSDADLWTYLGFTTGDIKSRGGTTSNYNYYRPTHIPQKSDNSEFLYSGLDQAGKGSQSPTSPYNYISPITNSQTCDGYGVYMLTAGGPNTFTGNARSTTLDTMISMGRLSLGNSGLAFGQNNECTSDLVNTADGQWKCLGEYSKLMRNTSNPSGKSIQTATIGYGKKFAAFSNVTPVMQTFTIDGQSKSKPVYDCDAVAGQDEKNLCKLGEYGQGYGSGGFYYVDNETDIIKSLQQFIGSVSKVIDPAPSGVITIPKDPYKAIGELPYAYIPTLEAQVSDSTKYNNIWPGNVKKFALKDGTLYGESSATVTTADTKLFTNTAGDSSPNVQDLWSADYVASGNNKVSSGGVYSNLNAPTRTNASTTRTVYVEDITSTSDTTPILRKISVTSNKPVGLNALVDTTYTRANKIKLLKFMGYTQATVGTGATATVTNLDALPTTTAIDDTLVLVAPTSPVKVLGASIHSKPIAVSYGADLDATSGALKDTTRDDYMLFGSMDGALHLVDADSYGTGTGGQEQWAIIPLKMMKTQSDALVPNSTYSDNNPARTDSVPYFGIDGVWTINAKYKYTYGTTNKVEPNGDIYAYGGLRLGGNGIYGFKLTNKSAPALAFFKDNNSPNFGRMGQIWYAPTVAKIKTSASDTGTDVLIFGGGYDTCYENPGFQVGVTDTTFKNDVNNVSCSNKTVAQGNAIYIVNATTGELIWSVSSTAGATKTHTNMTNSIVGGITALDRNNDGIIDHLYAADLGGQLFRVDFKGGVATADTSRVQRILADEATDKKYVRRFYEQPVVSFYKNGSSLFALVNLISGDRSSPLSKIRNDNGTNGMNADRVYGIIDNDVTKADGDYYTTVSDTDPALTDTSFKDITVTNLLNIPAELGAYTDAATLATKKAAINNILKAGVKGTAPNTTKIYGWYYPLTRFNGYNNVKFTKGMGRSEVIAGLLYTTTYNPDMTYGTTDPCKARVAGGSERQLYCLPYGVCADATSTNGTGGFLPAGQGIQELTLGPRSDTQSTQRLLIGNITLADVANQTNRVEFGGASTSNKQDATNDPIAKAQGLTNGDQAGGDGSMPGYIFNERYIITPKAWYEQN